MEKKAIFSALAGLFDPWFRKAAQRLAEGVPEESVFRSQSFEMALGAAKGFVEALAERMPPALGVLIEKATDVEDFFAGALKSGESQTFEKIMNDWQEEFLREFGERLKKAENPAHEFERLKLEFELRSELVKIVKEKTEVDNKQLGLFAKGSVFGNFFETQADNLRQFKEEFEKKEGFREEEKGGNQ